MNTFESKVIEAILDGDHWLLERLRSQLPHCRSLRTEFTDVGFFTDLTVGRSVPPAIPAGHRFQLGGVSASSPGLAHGAGFVLLVEDGYLSMLEGFTYAGEPFPTGDSLSLYSDPDLKAKDLARVDIVCGRRPAEA